MIDAVALVSLGLALAACGPPPDTLRTVATLPVPDSAAATLHIDSAGVFWLGAPGAVLRLDATSPAGVRLETGLPDVAEYAGERSDTIYFRTARALIAVSASADSVLAALEASSDVAILDVRGRFLFRAEGPGTVVAHDPATLEPIWGWAAVGSPAPALALSPEGDRVYQPAAATEFRDDPEILVRDLQTGRILRRVPLSDQVGALVAGPTGSLYGAVWDEDDPEDGEVFELEWSDGELEVAWDRSFRDLRMRAPLRLRIDPGGDALGVLSPNDEAGLHLLDVETGSSRGRLRGVFRDFAFDTAGRLYLLAPGELRRVE